MSVSKVYERRRKLEFRLGIQIKAPDHPNNTRKAKTHPGRIEFDVPDGIVIVGSDCHYWPGEPSTAHRAFVSFCKEYKPRAVVLNGDVLDFPQISRHPPIGWENQPTVQQEIESAQDRLHEIEKACGRARKIWTLGNHDARYETRLATVAPEYAKLNGFHLHDYFPLWETAWAVWINDVVIKHRFKSGIHAPHNNTVTGGKSIVTGHLHSAKVIPWTDYNGTRYGVDTGCIADPYARAFLDYTEDSPRSWRSGFGVLTFKDGKLLQPELVMVWDENTVQFRGELIKV